MIMFGKLRARWRLAGQLAKAEASGHVLMAVPEYMASEVYALRWRRNVEKASDRWAANVDNIPVTEWQAAISEAGRHRLAKPRRGHGDKSLPVIQSHPMSRPGRATARDKAVG